MSKEKVLMQFTLEKFLIISGATLLEKIRSIKAEGQLLSSLSLWWYICILPIRVGIYYYQYILKKSILILQSVINNPVFQICMSGYNFYLIYKFWAIQYVLLSVTKSRPTLCNPMNCSMPGSSVLYCLLEFAETLVHWVGDAIQLSHLLSPKYWSFSLCPSSE